VQLTFARYRDRAGQTDVKSKTNSIPALGWHPQRLASAANAASPLRDTRTDRTVLARSLRELDKYFGNHTGEPQYWVATAWLLRGWLYRRDQCPKTRQLRGCDFLVEQRKTRAFGRRRFGRGAYRDRAGADRPARAIVAKSSKLGGRSDFPDSSDRHRRTRTPDA